MTIKLNMTRDMNGFNTFGLMPSQDKQNTTLSATVAQTFTVPENPYGEPWLAIFFIEPGASVWFAYNDTATLPGVTVDDTNSEGNPTSWQVNSGDTISMISNNSTAEVGIKYYSIK